MLQIVPGRTTYKTGLDLSDAQPTPATVLYSRLPDTEYILVLVMFNDEKCVDPSTSLEVRIQESGTSRSVLNSGPRGSGFEFRSMQ